MIKRQEWLCSCNIGRLNGQMLKLVSGYLGTGAAEGAVARFEKGECENR